MIQNKHKYRVAIKQGNGEWIRRPVVLIRYEEDRCIVRYSETIIVNADGVPVTFTGQAEIDGVNAVLERCLDIEDYYGNPIYVGDRILKLASKWFIVDVEAKKLEEFRRAHRIIEEKEERKDTVRLFYVDDSVGDNGEYIATDDRVPTYWLRNEHFGYEGEGLVDPTSCKVSDQCQY